MHLFTGEEIKNAKDSCVLKCSSYRESCSSASFVIINALNSIVLLHIYLANPFMGLINDCIKQGGSALKNQNTFCNGNSFEIL